MTSTPIAAGPLDVTVRLRDYIANTDDCALRAEAADEIDRLRTELASVLAQRIEWRCRVGDEIFTTDDEEVAGSWRQDGFDVTKHVLEPNAELKDSA